MSNEELSNGEISIVFTLFCDDGNVNKSQDIAIVGNIPELGSWCQSDVRRGTYKADGEHSGKVEVEVMMPADRIVEWSWVILKEDGSIDIWDPVRRSTDIGKYGGRLFTYWGREEQLFNAPTCKVELSMEYFCHPGHTIVLVGREAYLGCWVPRLGVVARMEGYGQWTAQVYMQRRHCSQFKWVVVDAITGDPLRWEETEPRTMWVEEDCESMQLGLPWNADYIIYAHDRSRDQLDGKQLISMVQAAHEGEMLQDQHLGRPDPLKRKRSDCSQKVTFSPTCSESIESAKVEQMDSRVSAKVEQKASRESAKVEQKASRESTRIDQSASRESTKVNRRASRESTRGVLIDEKMDAKEVKPVEEIVDKEGGIVDGLRVLEPRQVTSVEIHIEKSAILEIDDRDLKDLGTIVSQAYHIDSSDVRHALEGLALHASASTELRVGGSQCQLCDNRSDVMITQIRSTELVVDSSTDNAVTTTTVIRTVYTNTKEHTK